MNLSGRPAEILLAEDNEDDFELTRIAFGRVRLTAHLHRVSDGEQCMAFLRREGEHARAPTPDIVLLDLNMPRMDGRQVLEEVSRDDRICHIPIIVLTSSDADADVFAAYKLHARSYIVKPVDFAKFENAIQTLSDYWFKLVRLPSNA